MDDRYYDNNKYRTSRRNDRYDDFDDFDDYSYDRKTGYGSGQRRKAKPEEDSPSILYDARGVRVKKSRVSTDFMKTLFFFVIPYLVINTIIFLLVTSAPKIKIEPITTDDYQSTLVKFTISSLVPLEQTIVTMESETLPFSKDGTTYTALITRNGTFYVEATSKNGMRSTAYADIAILDDTPPVIDDTSCHIEEGVLSFNVSDTQSGINWSQIYALDSEGNRHVPSAVDRDSGTVYMPMDVDYLELHVKDMVGNERTANVTATTEQITVKGPQVM